MSAPPVQRFIESQRVRIAYWDWGNGDAPNLVLVHGGGDHSRSWDRIASVLRDEYHVVALDLRGHGNSAPVPGGQYGLPDNALDVVRVIETVGAPSRVLAHSYGASVSLIAAATYPEVFEALVVLEGTHSLNPRDEEGMGPHWLRRWGDRVRGFEGSAPRVYPTLNEAAQRMREANPRLPLDFVDEIAAYASKPVDGGYVWKHDFWISGRTSMEVRREELPRFWEAVECPTLLVFAERDHTSSGQMPDAEKHFRSARSVRTAWVPDSGHWIHHDQPERLLTEVRGFLSTLPSEVAVSP